jgi:hypothetical protein
MTNEGTPTQRSGFVTGLAWIFIGLAGFATLIALLQNVMLSVMLPLEGLQASTQGTEDLPAFARFMFSHPRMIFGGFLAVAAITLVSAIGLLKRKNWARVLFIAIMVLGVLWNIGSLILPFYMYSAFVPPMPESTPQDFRESFEMTWKIMIAFTVVIALALATLFAWITKRLVSRDVKREFLAL